MKTPNSKQKTKIQDLDTVLRQKEDSQPYPWLDPNNKRADASSYFKDISYFVELQDSCFYDDSIEFVPLLLEIKNPEVRKAFDDRRYLLQVWNKSTGKKIYESSLTSKIKMWSIHDKYLIFTQEGLEQNIKIVQLGATSKENIKFFLTGFGPEMAQVNRIILNSNYMVFAFERKIRIFKMVDLIALKPEEGKDFVEIDMSKVTFQEYETEIRIVELFIMYDHEFSMFNPFIVFETKENKLDFNILQLKNEFNEAEAHDEYLYFIGFDQVRDVFPREAGYLPDVIQKFSYIVHDRKLFALALRYSGSFDIYVDMMHRTEIRTFNTLDVEMSFFAFYFKIREGGAVFELKHKGENMISINDAVEITEDGISTSIGAMKRIQNFVQIYSDFITTTKIGEKSLCLISHQNFVSFYELHEEKWIAHLCFPSDVIKIFLQNPYQWNPDPININVLLENQEIFIDIEQYLADPTLLSKKPADLKIAHQVKSCIEIGHPSYYIGSYFFLILSPELNKITIVANNQLTVQDFGDICITNMWPITFDVSVGTNYGPIPFICSVQYTYCVSKFELSQRDKPYIDQIKQLAYYYSDKEHLVHTVYSSDLESNLIIFDPLKASVCDIKSGIYSVVDVENLNCKKILNMSSDVTYGIFQETLKSERHGLMQLDMHALLKKTVKVKLLKKIDIGGLSLIQEDQKSQRIAFVSSISKIVVCPILHKNVNQFMGAVGNTFDIYLAKAIDNVLVVVAKSPTLMLFKYNIYTGKLIGKEKINPETLFDNYKVYQENAEWETFYGFQEPQKKKYLLLTSIEPITQTDDCFFTPEQLLTNLKNQTPMMKVKKHKFSHFLITQINEFQQFEISCQFSFACFTNQKMFINDRKDRLITSLKGDRIYLYKRFPDLTANPSDMAGITKIKWDLMRQIVDFPFNLQNSFEMFRLFQFSDDFAVYLRQSKKHKVFEVKYTDSGKLHSTVPNDILRIRYNETPYDVIRRFKWISSSQFAICDPDGFERIINIDKNYLEETYNSIPLFEEIIKNDYGYDRRIYFDAPSQSEDTLLRLKLMYARYKTDYYLFKKSPKELYQGLLRPYDNDLRKFEHSFTFLNWSLIDQLKNKDIKIKDQSEETLKYMIYNILPGGNTILHSLFYSQFKLKKIYEKCHTEDQIVHHIPFMHNFEGKSPFDLSLGLGQKDYKTVFYLLKFLALYPIDHHSKAIKNCYSIMIDEQLPELLEYLESRFFCNTEDLEDLKQGEIHKNLITASLTYEDTYVKQEMFMNETTGGSIKVEMLDMPGVYHFEDLDFEKLMKALSNSESFAFFESKAIQAIIDFNFSQVRQFLIYFSILPFLVFHVIFVTYMNVVYERRLEDVDFDQANKILASIQIVLAAYFLFNEFRQIISIGVSYATSVWNYIDLLAPSGVIILHAFQFSEFYGTSINLDLNRCVIAISTLLMWLKLLSVLRIFRKTSYLIRTIVEVIFDMGIFLFVLLVVITAFGDSFLKISNGNDDENKFIEDFLDSILFTYTMNLGDYDRTAFGEVAKPLVQIFWIMCTILIMIVMLNLLIAIISGTYEKVTDNMEQASYQEMAALISENYYLIPKRIRQSYAQKNKFLLVGTDLETLNDDQDPWLFQFQKVREEVQDMKKYFEKQKLVQEEKKVLKKEEIQKQVEDQRKLVGDIKVMLAKSSPVETVNLKTHNNPLQKMLLYQIQELYNFDRYSAAYCDGKKFVGLNAALTIVISAKQSTDIIMK